MIKLKYILVFLVLASPPCFSQSFSNLDSLLIKNYEAVNKRDSSDYLSLINQSAIYKNAKTKTDSLTIIKPFLEAFHDVIDELTEMAMTSDFTVTYSNYEYRNKNNTKEGRLMLHVNLIINDSFTVKMPFSINAQDGRYTIESPMLVMVVDNKE